MRQRKGRSRLQALQRSGMLMLFPLLVATWIFPLTSPEYRPDGAGVAVGLLIACSLLAAAVDCSGLLICPFGLACFMLFALQLALLLVVLLALADPESMTTVHRPLRPEPIPELIVAAAPGLPAAKTGIQAALAELGSEQRVGSSDRGAVATSPALPEPVLLRSDARLSVVLACADEANYAVKTALKIVERTPLELLEEVILVDDGSAVPIEDAFDQAGVGADDRATKRIRVIRDPETLGLMIAKKTGGDNAKGDIIVFLDCHVSTQPNWHEEIRRLIIENPRRMVVPAITDLDLNTWEESPHSNVNTKTYLTWNADFDWFDDDSPYVPVMSGGLLALSAYWWNATGGYDGSMRGWGGENLDQSLRSWLCGGEIVMARSSRIAHMWRVPNDDRTRVHYKSVGSAQTNKLRVVMAWFGPFQVLFPGRGPRSLRGHIDVSGITRVQERMGCKPLVHFLHRFRDVYIEGGVIPVHAFQLREKSSGLCMTRQADTVRLQKCGRGGKAGRQEQQVHGANRINDGGGSEEHKCCSGIRFLSTDLCIDYFDNNDGHTYLCDITGANLNQRYSRLEDGRISHNGLCMARKGKGATLKMMPCDSLVGTEGQWEELEPFEPTETRCSACQDTSTICKPNPQGCAGKTIPMPISPPDKLPYECLPELTHVPWYASQHPDVPVVIVTSEISPWSKSGGLALVTASLAVEMAARGHRTMAISPMYDNYPDCEFMACKKIWLFGWEHEVKYFHQWHTLEDGKKGVDYVFVDHPCYHRPGGLYYNQQEGVEYADNLFRFALFCLAALEAPCCLAPGGVPFGDRVMFLANDWQTALLPVYLTHRMRPMNRYQQLLASCRVGCCASRW
ncbi:unnamed protein product [Polarella glacialis]|uniref:Polypeptide N-acetylgalactosaminyltransferase n=1 Tax=Polarella glacialis TaxID=89957 RepID=A0A813DEH2_POLGL|nr:unnamed protein product [Polarella glacialis]